MPELSLRIQETGFSPMRKLLPYAEKAKKDGVKIFHLNIGQPDIPTPKPYFDALKKFAGKEGNNVDEYVKSQGLESLRKNFVEYTKLTVSGTEDMEIDNCMITMGGSEALEKLAFTLFNDGDKVIVPEPFYANYNTFFGSNGVDIVPYTTSVDDNFALGNVVLRIRKLIEDDKRIRGIVITNPGNPTGTVYNEKEMEGIAEIVKDNNLWLIADEVYREFVYDDEKPRSFLSMESIRQNTIVVDSVSKKWSACGARTGAVFSFNEAVMTNLLKCLQSRLSASRVNQEASAAMIGADVRVIKERKKTDIDTKTSVEKARDEYEKRRKAAYDIFKKNGIKCGYPKGALYLIADIGDKNGEPLDSEDFCRFMLEEFRHENKTVMVTFAKGFYKSEGLGRSQIRLAFVLNEKDTKEATEILCMGIDAYREK